jgi:hypothetical protein
MERFPGLFREQWPFAWAHRVDLGQVRPKPARFGGYFDSCWTAAMVKEESAGQPPKAGRSVVGRSGFAKVSAVEGIHSTEAMRKRAAEKRARGPTAEEYRRAIISSHRKD